MKYLTYLLLLSICIFPKINIISVSGSTAGIRIEDLLIAIFVVLYIVSNTKNGKIKIRSKKTYNIFKIFAIYIFICIISSVWGIYKGWIRPVLALLFLIRKIEYFCMIFVGYDYWLRTKDENKINKIMDWCVLFHFIISLLQLAGVIGSFNKGEMLSKLTQGRVSSTFNGAYEFSGFLLLFLPFYLYKLINLKENVLKNLIYVLITLFCIYISESRTSLAIAFIIILLILLKVASKNTKKILVRFLLSTSIIVLIIVAFNWNKIDLKRFDTVNIKGVKNVFIISWKNKNFERYNKYGNWFGNVKYSGTEIEKAGMDPSLYTRVSHWMQMIDGWLKTPIIGLGVSISESAADGNYVRILAESGILGLIAWIYLLLSIRKNINKTQNPEILYSLLSIILGALLIDIFEASKIMMTFWFMIGLSCGKEQKREDD